MFNDGFKTSGLKVKPSQPSRTQTKTQVVRSWFKLEAFFKHRRHGGRRGGKQKEEEKKPSEVPNKKKKKISKIMNLNIEWTKGKKAVAIANYHHFSYFSYIHWCCLFSFQLSSF